VRCALVTRRSCAGRQAKQAQIRPKLEATGKQLRSAAGNPQLYIMARQSARPQGSCRARAIIAVSPLTPTSRCEPPRERRYPPWGQPPAQAPIDGASGVQQRGRSNQEAPRQSTGVAGNLPSPPRHEESPAGEARQQGADSSKHAIATAAAERA